MKKLISLIILLPLLVFAREIPVDFTSDKGTEKIKAKADNILANEEIDITIPFSAGEKDVIKFGLNFTEKEEEVLNKILSDTAIEPNDMESFVSVFSKLQKEKELSDDEKKMTTGLNTEKKNAKDVIKYLSRKKALDI